MEPLLEGAGWIYENTIGRLERWADRLGVKSGAKAREHIQNQEPSEHLLAQRREMTKGLPPEILAVDQGTQQLGTSAKATAADLGEAGTRTVVRQGVVIAVTTAVAVGMAKAGEAAEEISVGNAPMRGAANPKVAEALRKGQKAHVQRTYPEGFEKEVELPSGKRMDAYNKATKQVRELKPGNSRAVRRGEKQIEGYCKECDEAFGPGHTGTVETYDPTKIK
jgi:hypothetical protein